MSLNIEVADNVEDSDSVERKSYRLRCKDSYQNSRVHFRDFILDATLFRNCYFDFQLKTGSTRPINIWKYLAAKT